MCKKYPEEMKLPNVQEISGRKEVQNTFTAISVITSTTSTTSTTIFTISTTTTAITASSRKSL